MSATLHKAKWFSLSLVALPLVLFVAAIWLAGTNWFLDQALPAYMRGLDSEYALRDQPCDLLIFGDSSALTGIEPRPLAAQTGLRVCDIARTKGETGVTGLGFLERYLAQNPPPKVLVLAFAPEDWHPAASWSEVAYVEGITQLVRHYRKREMWLALARHPNEAFGYVTFVYKQATLALLHRHPNGGPNPANENGHMTLPKPAETACLPLAPPGHAAPYWPPDASYIQSLRQKFSAGGAEVLMVVSPQPECDPQRAHYLADLTPLVDITFPAYPIGDFNDVNRHFTRQGSMRYTQQLAAELNRRMKGGAR